MWITIRKIRGGGYYFIVSKKHSFPPKKDNSFTIIAYAEKFCNLLRGLQACVFLIYVL